MPERPVELVQALEEAQAQLVEARVGELPMDRLASRMAEVLAPLADAGAAWDQLRTRLVARAGSLAEGDGGSDARWETLFQAFNRTVRRLEEEPPPGPEEVEALMGEVARELDAKAQAAIAAPTRDVAPRVSEAGLDAFAAEGRDLVLELEQAALQVGGDPGALRRALRALHTLKGNAGFLGLADMVQLVHQAEELLAAVRDGACAASPAGVEGALLVLHDHLAGAVEAVEERRPPQLEVTATLAELRGLLDPADDGVAAPLAPAPSLPASDGGRGRVTTRVEVRKLDELFDWMGESILARMRLGDRAAKLRAAMVADRGGAGWDVSTSDSLERMVLAVEEAGRSQSQLEDQLMGLRLMPVGTVFQRLPRLVHQTARQLEKRVDLTLNGEEVELDKAVAECLAEPLLHLVRNALDHGLERPEARRAAGKPEVGRLQVSAHYSGDRVVIEVLDDGAGVDVDRLVARALEAGVVDAEELERLDERGRLLLLLRPGLSTATLVSDISGRGIGMDVVNRRIEELKGSLELETRPGRGTRVRLLVPLTMALIDVLLVDVAGRTLGLPLYVVRETLRVPRGDIELMGSCEVIPVRGSYLPVIHLGRILGLDPRPPAPLAHLVVLEVAGAVVAAEVDVLLRRYEAVLKPLGALLSAAPFVAGTTLLEDGRVVPILDTASVLRGSQTGRAARREAPSPEASQRRRGRVLLAEDSTTVRDHLAGLLRGAGFEVVAVEDGRRALEESLKAPFDLVSTDIQMPEMDGYEFCARLREEPQYHSVPVVAVTSYGERVDRVRGFEAGFDEYLVKPIDEAAYLGCIDRLLGRRLGDPGPAGS